MHNLLLSGSILFSTHRLELTKINERNGTENNNGTGKRVPTQVPWQNHAPSGVNNVAPERNKHTEKEDESDVDGKVIFKVM